ncbi:energy-coupling factor transport system permease protein [Desulfitispora alkaliphila]|uniref:energy-coupling factor transporter transmembrane component T family protein n=1 Tax=Desulfitispora alkaliphila TaxID=622674 RepID=UPI003D1F642C
MIKDITLGQYLPGNSSIHLLDPRVKILAVGGLMVTVFLTTTAIGFTAWLILLGAIVALTKIPIKYIWRGVRPIFIIIGLTVFIHIFFTPGDTIAQWGILTITQEGLERGVTMGLRIFSLIVITSVLTLTTSPVALTDGLEYLLAPLKKMGVPVHEIAMMMTIALRFIPTLLEEADKIMKAQMARGMDFATGPILKRIKNIVPLLVPLFVSAFRRADDLATAMEARCYRGGQGRTRMKELKMSRSDYVALSTIAAVCTALIILG